MPSRYALDRNRSGVDQRRLPLALAPHQPPDERAQGHRSDRYQRPDRLAAFLPHEDAQHDTAHPDHREGGADDVDASVARIRHVAHQPYAGQDDRDHDALEQEGHPPRQDGGDEAAEQRADGSRDRGRGADQGVDLLLSGPMEVAVDERLHRRQEERGADPADHGPEHDDGDEVLGQRHRHGADGVAEQTEHVRPLATEQVADLAPDQDECRGDERLEGDGRLDAAHGGVEVLHDRRDRHVHQRRVDDEHEHRHREQQAEAPAARFPGRGGGHSQSIGPSACS
jgi:hypothetical protein